MNDIKKIAKWFVIILSIIATIILINQFVLFYNFLAQIHILLAIVITLSLIILMGYFIYKLWQQLHMNYPVIDMNGDTSKEDIDQYYKDLRHHLMKETSSMNPSPDMDDIQAVNEYFEMKDQETKAMILENANAIFLTTAISQNGSLDSMVVLYSMMRMIWQLARAYKTRPTLMSLGKLYVQVMSVILMTRGLEDTDLIEEQMEPLITSIIGESIASAIPGMVPISNLTVGSMMEGAVNAFLTLRVGIVTQNYLKGGIEDSQKSIRRSASVQSIQYMGSIIKNNSKIVLETMVKSIRKAGADHTKKWFDFVK